MKFRRMVRWRSFDLYQSIKSCTLFLTSRGRVVTKDTMPPSLIDQVTVADSTEKYGCRVVFDVRLRNGEVVDHSPPTGVAHPPRRPAEDTGLPHDDGCGNAQCQKCDSQYVRGQLECYECGSKFNFGSIRLVVIDTPTRGPVHDDNCSPWAKPYQRLLAPPRIPDNL